MLSIAKNSPALVSFELSGIGICHAIAINTCISTNWLSVRVMLPNGQAYVAYATRESIDLRKSYIAWRMAKRIVMTKSNGQASLPDIRKARAEILSSGAADAICDYLTSVADKAKKDVHEIQKCMEATKTTYSIETGSSKSIDFDDAFSEAVSVLVKEKCEFRGSYLSSEHTIARTYPRPGHSILKHRTNTGMNIGAQIIQIMNQAWSGTVPAMITQQCSSISVQIYERDLREAYALMHANRKDPLSSVHLAVANLVYQNRLGVARDAMKRCVEKISNLSISGDKMMELLQEELVSCVQES